MANSGSVRMEHISGKTSLSGHDGHPTINWQLDTNSINYDTRTATINYQVVAGGSYWSGAQDGVAWIETGRTYIRIAGESFYLDRSTWYKNSTIKTGSFTITYSEDGNYSFTVEGWSHVWIGDTNAASMGPPEYKRANVAVGGYIGGTETFNLDKVNFYSRVYDARTGEKTKHVWYTTDKGVTWRKCNAYRTSNGGANWTKIT